MIEKEAALPNDREAEDVQQEFMAESEVQRARIGEFSSNQGTQGGAADASQSYESFAGFNEPEMPKAQHNPFEMPAGYPDQDGYKKSIVAKQNLPLNEPHPGINLSIVDCF